MLSRIGFHSDENITTRISFNGIGYEIIEFQKINSTNDFLKNQLPVKFGKIIQAREQTQGRGRKQSRVWENMQGNQIMFSFSFPHNLPNPAFLSLIAGIALYDSLSHYSQTIHLKWPNDILSGNKKISGILCENIPQDNRCIAIIGMGINFYGDESNLPTTLSDKAGYLVNEDFSNITEEKFFIVKIVDKFKNLVEGYTQSGADEIIQMWKKHCGSFGRNILFGDGDQQSKGQFMDISPEGYAVIKTEEDKLVTIAGGEIEFY